MLHIWSVPISYYTMLHLYKLLQLFHMHLISSEIIILFFVRSNKLVVQKWESVNT